MPARKRAACRNTFERLARRAGARAVAGVDEVGRGCLFGPVFAAAAILDPAKPIRGLNDSKQLEADRREALAERIRERAAAWAIGAADCFEIDRVNILQAAGLAMKRAVEGLSIRPDFLLVDGIYPVAGLEGAIEQKTLIKGDARSQSIAAASILAKVARDAAMAEWDAVFPEYGLARHKGYYTPEHVAAIGERGPTWLHRYSFDPVRQPVLRGSSL